MGETITFGEFFEDAREGGVALTTRKGMIYLRPTSYKGFAVQPDAPELTLYSQHDLRWAERVYAGGTTFAEAGCYVTAVAMSLSLAGYEDDPPTVAENLFTAGCFVGNLLTSPERIPDAYPKMEYAGTYRWHDSVADMDIFLGALKMGPVIAEVDFRPTTKRFNQHFVLVESWDEEGEDVWIADPWDGTRVRLLERYELTWYMLLGHQPKVENAICGLRILRPRDGNP
jgi:hypothetical protein